MVVLNDKSVGTSEGLSKPSAQYPIAQGRYKGALKGHGPNKNRIPSGLNKHRAKFMQNATSTDISTTFMRAFVAFHSNHGVVQSWTISRVTSQLVNRASSGPHRQCSNCIADCEPPCPFSMDAHRAFAGLILLHSLVRVHDWRRGYRAHRAVCFVDSRS